MPTTPPSLLLVSVAALINSDGLILLTQRPKGKSMPDLWEFPGGKLKPGETPQEAIIRELREEINIDVAPQDLQPVSFIEQRLKNVLLILLLFITRHWKKDVSPQENQKMIWIPPERLGTYPMPPASLPLIKALGHFLGLNP